MSREVDLANWEEAGLPLEEPEEHRDDRDSPHRHEVRQVQRVFLERSPTRDPVRIRWAPFAATSSRSVVMGLDHRGRI